MPKPRGPKPKARRGYGVWRTWPYPGMGWDHEFLLSGDGGGSMSLCKRAIELRLEEITAMGFSGEIVRVVVSPAPRRRKHGK